MNDRSSEQSTQIATVTTGTRIAVFLLGMCAMLNLYPTQPILALISKSADVSASTAAWTISASTLGVAICAPFAGAISDYVGRKRVIAWAIVTMITTALLCVIAPSFHLIVALRFLQGVSIPFIFAVVVAYIAEEYAVGDAARLNAIYVAGTAFGGLSARLLGGFVATITDEWVLVFLPIAAIQIFTLMVMRKHLPTEQRFVPTSTVGAGLRGLADVLRNSALLATCFIGASLLFLQVTSFTYVSLYLQSDTFGFSPFQTSLVYLILLIPVLVTPSVGKVVARVGVVPTFTSGVLLAIGGLLLTMLPFAWAVILGLAGSCMAVFIGQVCTTRFTAQRFVRSRSAAVGWYLTGYYLGGTIGGVAPAPIFEAQGWNAIVGLLIAVAAIAAFVAWLSWRE